MKKKVLSVFICVFIWTSVVCGVPLSHSYAAEPVCSGTLASVQRPVTTISIRDRLEEMCGGPLTAERYREYYREKYGVDLHEEMAMRRAHAREQARRTRRTHHLLTAELLSYLPLLLFAVKAMEVGNEAVAMGACAIVLGMALIWRCVHAWMRASIRKKDAHRWARGKVSGHEFFWLIVLGLFLHSGDVFSQEFGTTRGQAILFEAQGIDHVNKEGVYDEVMEDYFLQAITADSTYVEPCYALALYYYKDQWRFPDAAAMMKHAYTYETRPDIYRSYYRDVFMIAKRLWDFTYIAEPGVAYAFVRDMIDINAASPLYDPDFDYRLKNFLESITLSPTSRHAIQWDLLNWVEYDLKKAGLSSRRQDITVDAETLMPYYKRFELMADVDPSFYMIYYGKAALCLKTDNAIMVRNGFTALLRALEMTPATLGERDMRQSQGTVAWLAYRYGRRFDAIGDQESAIEAYAYALTVYDEMKRLTRVDKAVFEDAQVRLTEYAPSDFLPLFQAA